MDETNLLNAVRHELGEATLAELRSNPRLLQQALDVVPKAYNAWRPPEAPAPKLAGELRPVFAPSAVTQAYEVAQTLQSLLVSHSVAIIIPDSIGYLGRLVWLLTELEEAIDAGLVHILSEATVGSAPMFDQLLAEWATEMNRHKTSKHDPTRDKEIQDRLEAADVALALDACSRFPDSFDLACRTRAQRDWLRGQVARIPARVTASQGRTAFMSELLAIDLPVVDLKTKDLLALRREGGFDQWRQALAQTVQDIAAIDEDSFVDPASGSVALMRERMEIAAERITQETQALPRRALGETASFGLACAGGAIGALAGGPLGAAAVSAGAYVTTRLVEWLNSRPSASDRVVRRLVVELFGPRH